ncbi:MAG: site-specific integrase [Erysipelotrichaceae bacterium]|nr:site-specific integrase [Erysipelotrichaceae bacterium]
MATYKDEKRGTWMYRTTYKDFTGKTRYKTKRGFDTQRDARRAEREFLSKRDQEGVQENKMTFLELLKRYIENQKLKNKESTYITTENKMTNHVTPYFGNKKISEITILDIEKWQNTLLALNKYSITYLQGIHSKFSSVMKYGIKLGLLSKNVVEMHGNFVQNSKYRKKEMLFYTFEEWQAFEKVLPEDTYKIFFQFLYYTGARQGEALALTFEDFNSDFSEVNINKTITYKTKKKGFDVTTTKTLKSSRKVSIPYKLSKSLQETFNKYKNVEGFKKESYMFGLTRPLSPTQICRRKDKACEEAGVKRIRIHDFRHSACSLLINSGVPPIVISKRLGHSNVATTLRVYSHMFESTEDQALKLLNENLGG